MTIILFILKGDERIYVAHYDNFIVNPFKLYGVYDIESRRDDIFYRGLSEIPSKMDLDGLRVQIVEEKNIITEGSNTDLKIEYLCEIV